MSRWIRLTHRWLAPIFIVVFIAVISTQGSSIGPILQRIQQGMVLVFALSGLYLFVLPWWSKWQRAQKRKRAGTAPRQTPTG